MTDGMTLDDHGLGRLGPVEVRTIWAGEATDFTPWMAAHFDLLSTALDLPEVVDVRQEVAVGGFALDILATHDNGQTTAVENQLEESDHRHLGQLLVYAAGLGASTVVWVTRAFRDEHRAVLDWLNERPGVDFFGVEVRAVQIGDSAPAPVFEVVAKPNGWEKSARQQTTRRQAGQSPSEAAARRQEFYARCLHHIAGQVPTFQPGTPSTSNWYDFRTGPFGSFRLYFPRDGRFGVEVYLDPASPPDPGMAKRLFDELHADRDAVEAQLGPLEWDRNDGVRYSRVGVYRFAPDLTDPDQLEEAARWAGERGAALLVALEERLRALAGAMRRSTTGPSDGSRTDGAQPPVAAP